MDLVTDGEVKDAIEALPEQFRMAVLLADVEGFSYKEIAEILDIPIGTVMSRLHRGRKGAAEDVARLRRRPEARARRPTAMTVLPRTESGLSSPSPIPTDGS